MQYTVYLLFGGGKSRTHLTPLKWRQSLEWLHYSGVWVNYTTDGDFCTFKSSLKNIDNMTTKAIDFPYV